MYQCVILPVDTRTPVSKGFIIIHDEENKGIFAELLFVSYHKSFRVLLIQGGTVNTTRTNQKIWVTPTGQKNKNMTGELSTTTWDRVILRTRIARIYFWDSNSLDTRS